MGENLGFDNIFIKSGNGDYILFSGIKPLDPSDILIVDDMDEETYNSLPKEGTIEFHTDDILLDKKFRKWSKKISNQYRRRVRYEKRLKEYARRRALKNEGTNS